MSGVGITAMTTGLALATALLEPDWESAGTAEYFQLIPDELSEPRKSRGIRSTFAATGLSHWTATAVPVKIVVSRGETA
jgi:hypothetical protein